LNGVTSQIFSLSATSNLVLKRLEDVITNKLTLTARA